ncbi:MAG: hypothetical protein ACR2RB_14800 [Gammaproteobacteria bacterium]
MKRVLILSAAAVTLAFAAPVFAGGASGCKYGEKMKQAYADDSEQKAVSALTEEQSQAMQKLHSQLTGEDSAHGAVLVTEQPTEKTE